MSGAAFVAFPVGRARQIDPGYLATIDHIAYSLRDEGKDANGSPVEGMYAYPSGQPHLAVRICGGHVSMANLDRLYDGLTTPERILQAHGVPAPEWMDR